MHIGWDAFYKMHLTRCIDGYSEVGIGWEWTNEVYILRWYVQWNDNNYLQNLWYINEMICASIWSDLKVEMHKMKCLVWYLLNQMQNYISKWTICMDYEAYNAMKCMELK